jgi:hypothetical protein
MVEVYSPEKPSQASARFTPFLAVPVLAGGGGGKTLIWLFKREADVSLKPEIGGRCKHEQRRQQDHLHHDEGVQVIRQKTGP